MASQVVPVNVQVPSTPTAPVVADFVEHALRVAYVARPHVEGLPRDEWNAPGIYVLLTGDGSGAVYVGQAVELRQRLLQHRRAPKLDWQRAVAIKRDTSHGFNSAEIGYLEGRLAAELDAIPHVTVIKGKEDKDTTLPPHLLLSLDALLSSVLAALRLAGVDIWKEADEAEATPKRGYTQIPGTVADLLAAGLLRAGAGLYLSQGGKTGEATVTTAGELVVDGVAYASPSKAAMTVLGRSSNGWETWRVGSEDGPSLGSLRAQLSA